MTNLVYRLVHTFLLLEYLYVNPVHMYLNIQESKFYTWMNICVHVIGGVENASIYIRVYALVNSINAYLYVYICVHNTNIRAYKTYYNKYILHAYFDAYAYMLKYTRKITQICVLDGVTNILIICAYVICILLKYTHIYTRI